VSIFQIPKYESYFSPLNSKLNTTNGRDRIFFGRTNTEMEWSVGTRQHRHNIFVSSLPRCSNVLNAPTGALWIPSSTKNSGRRLFADSSPTLREVGLFCYSFASLPLEKSCENLSRDERVRTGN